MTIKSGPVNPRELRPPIGFSHGVLAPPGSRMLFVAGQSAADKNGRIVDKAFPRQFEAALACVLKVVAEAGGRPEHLASMTVYVTDLDGYLAARPELGRIWKRLVGPHYPAMALVDVKRLYDADATVEIEATAMVPP
jgi:enamine deaminase RidA (YjgF/YER057c/UK114 family)